MNGNKGYLLPVRFDLDFILFFLFQGDKGGSTTKLAVQICNIQNSNSADNTDLVAFFEGTDSEKICDSSSQNTPRS